MKVEKILPTATHQYGAYNKVDDYFHQHTCTVCQKAEVREHAWSVSEEHILGPCDENGTVDMQCADCNATYTKAYMPTDTHAFEAWNAVDAATHQRICTGCGKFETSVHTWDKGTIHIEFCGSVGTIEYVCTSCGYTYSEDYTSNAEHVYAYQKKDEQTHTYECMLCHNDKGTSDHRWNNGVSSIKGACDENGTITYTCIDCSATKTENYVPTSVHTFGAWMRQDGERHKHTCMVCEKSESADHRWNNGVLSIKGTCDESGKVSYTCTDCGATKTVAYVPTAPHTFGEWSRQNDEMHRHTCTACGKSERADHRWDEGFSSIEGICDENGTTTYTCIDCGMIRIVYYQPQAPHSYEMWERVDDQSHCRVCSTCGREETRAHDWIGGEIHASAACDENGYRLYSCVACGISRQEPINPTSHSFGEWSYNATLHLMERVCLCGKKETQAGATTPPISAGGVQILPGQDLFLPVGTELIAEKLSDSAEDAVFETVMEQLAYLNQGATPFAAYDIYLMANGASVSAGNEITISIPTSAAEIERFESVSVYYLSDGGRLYACPTTVEDGAVHFTTLSNGRFLIVGKEAEPNRAWIWILVVGLVVLGGAVVAVLLLLKKKNTQATSSGSYQAKNSADVKSAGDATVSGQEKPRT